MDNYFKISERKQVIIDAYEKAPFVVGENVYVPHKRIHSYSTASDKGKYELWYVRNVSDDNSIISVSKNMADKNIIEVKVSECNKFTHNVGINPFADIDWHSIAETHSYSLDSIIFRITERDARCELKDGSVVTVPNINWNPYIIDSNGNKQYYQRDFCWTLHDKQLLIESIYNYIECGKIVFRKHSYEDIRENWSDGDKSMCWFDIVDGKQRMNALLGFVNDEYQDLHGNYFSDFSNKAKNEFLENQLITFCDLGEKSTDADAIRTFLSVNYTGVPMSQEHIDYVKSINL